jgi:hypothetical protein
LILKRSPTIRTVVLKKYSFLLPVQLRFASLRINSPVSLIFTKCPLPSDVLSELMGELSSFGGEFQRFTFQNLELVPATCESLFSTLASGRPFRSLEVLELDFFTMRQPIREVVALVGTGIERALRHLRFLKRFSCARWSIPFWLPISLFGRVIF